jgi:putative transposase
MANRPPRFPDFDYTGWNRYFLTVCVNQRTPVFKDIALGKLLATHFLTIATCHGFEIFAYCVMPDHFHALAAGQRDDCDLKRFMHRWKQATGYWWKHDRGRRSRLWQEGFHDRILRDQDVTESVVRYILENPVRAGLVDDPREYPLMGASHYDLDDLLEFAMRWKPPWK